MTTDYTNPYTIFIKFCQSLYDNSKLDYNLVSKEIKSSVNITDYFYFFF